MAQPTIVPPTPTVRQGEPIQTQVDSSPGIEVVQNVFDRVFPAVKTEPTKKEPTVSKEPPQKTQAPAETVTPAAEPAKEQVTPTTEPSKQPSDESHKTVPSFIEDALKTTIEPAKPPADPEWPEELPTFKTPEESKDRYRKWRESYNQLKSEVTQLRSRPTGADETTTARLQSVEQENQTMRATLARMGVEQHADFQRNVVQPLTVAWRESARIVQEAGGDPNELARALSLSGKAQFEALDQVFSEMPESAKAEAYRHITDYRRLNDVRAQWLNNAPKVMQELHKKDLERQYQVVNQQREEMRNLFSEAGRRLREEGKVEVLQKSNNPEDKWWNDQAEAIEKTANDLYLENTDMGKLAMAAWLASMTDAYRKLWISERLAHNKTKGVMSEKFGSEPSLSESSGGENRTPDAKLKSDLNRPFAQVFLEEFHRQQARNR